MNNRRRAIMGIAKSGGRLPSAYQEVEYLESTGEQYINTQYTPVQYDEFEISKVKIDPYSSISCVLSAGDSNAQLPFIAVITLSGTTVYFKCFATGAAPENSNVSLQTDTTIKITSNGELYYDDNLVLTSPYEGPLGDYPLYLFSRNGASQFMKGTMGCIKITNNNITKHYYIPCYRKADNKPGMYDLVNGVFYTNANTSASTDFIIGNDVN